jgi:hypothetical protein
MSTSISVAVRSYTHAITYVADNLLKSVKDILLHSGLDPSKLASNREALHRGISRWIESGHLRKIVLEVYAPSTNRLVGRWDISISYEWTGGDGEFWADTDMIRFAIKKAGILPSSAEYTLIVDLATGSPPVPGWTSTTYRSVLGMVEQRIGTTIEAGGLSGGVSYYRTR